MSVGRVADGSYFLNFGINMITDMRLLPDHSILETDLCVIGGGAAGIAIARGLSGSRLRVLLAESGDFDPDPSVQSLYQGQSVGEAYGAELDACRSRYFGGSTNCWGGMCLPLSECDFRAREWVAHSGWPICYQELKPYLIRAHKLCDRGPYLYAREIVDLLPSTGRRRISTGRLCSSLQRWLSRSSRDLVLVE